MRVLVKTPPYRVNSGGILALHKLVSLINEVGGEAVAVTPSKEGEINVIDTDWVVYPEIERGNPLNASNVVRWVLNTPGVVGGDMGTWGVEDLVFKYSDQFYCPVPYDGSLTICDFRLEAFTPPVLEDRGDRTLYGVYKGRRYFDRYNQHPNDAAAIELMSFEEMLYEMGRSKAFYCYDNESYYAVMAALMGCDSIVIPKDTEMTPEEFRSQHPAYKYGIAYGDDDLEYARETRHLLRPYLNELDEQQKVSVKEFLTILENYGS